MTTWTVDELTKIGTAEELEIVSLRSDGTLTKAVTIWVVRLGDNLFVRSVNGRAGAWFRGLRCATKATSWLAASRRTLHSSTLTLASTTRSTPSIAQSTAATPQASSATS